MPAYMVVFGDWAYFSDKMVRQTPFVRAPRI
jgi:hypothetical protein